MAATDLSIQIEVHINRQVQIAPGEVLEYHDVYRPALPVDIDVLIATPNASVKSLLLGGKTKAQIVDEITTRVENWKQSILTARTTPQPVQEE